MCFSASASFTAAAVLLGLGTVTMRRARSRRELPYAAIPLLFGVQQLLEGMLWLTFPDRAPLLNVALTHLYSFFSHVLWPIYVPLAALALESVRWRRRVLVAIAVAGALVGLYLLAMLVKLPITARVVGQHILYDSPHFYVMTTMALYLIGTCASLMVSSHRRVAAFGVAVKAKKDKFLCRPWEVSSFTSASSGSISSSALPSSSAYSRSASSVSARAAFSFKAEVQVWEECASSMITA